MNYQIRIQDPSGETRTLKIPTDATELVLGNDRESHIPLRDPSLGFRVGRLVPHRNEQMKDRSSSLWICLDDSTPTAKLAGVRIKSSELPLRTPVRLGETLITLESRLPIQDLPSFPTSTRAWITASESGKKLLWLSKKAAATPLSVYLAGETGVGKEVLAHLIHAWSDRAAGPFVPIHCGALPVSLAESELFGHVKGAFTGATHHRPGAFLQAHNGTLFLDEIGDLPLDIQVKLLRFLENGEIRPVGADQTTRADVRILCATHHPLRKLVEEGKFRRDLYFRLASVTLEIPTLRSRPEDIELLATEFAQNLKKTLSAEALLRLKAYVWPGNVRELRHTIERACALAGAFDHHLSEEHFEFLISPETIEENPTLEFGSSVLKLHEMERLMLLKALRLTHGNRAQAAKVLGVARSTLFEMLKRYRIQGPKQRIN